ncbi:hypothetical protein EYF80_050040 [Liparis tanakae]|uniref:Uncharacterized protein n=1 Tax=Liparis tanakae TaxID=230148 RepID=A0A4Z2FFW6_9TELE|nr:hypothetical protein EYF80_050040 [Liparis tanakae]
MFLCGIRAYVVQITLAFGDDPPDMASNQRSDARERGCQNIPKRRWTPTTFVNRNNTARQRGANHKRPRPTWKCPDMQMWSRLQ